MACCSTWSHSRWAKDGTWLGWRSLGCRSGATDAGGTPDVDAERPNRQLDFDSEMGESRNTSEQERVLLQQAETLWIQDSLETETLALVMS